MVAGTGAGKPNGGGGGETAGEAQEEVGSTVRVCMQCTDRQFMGGSNTSTDMSGQEAMDLEDAIVHNMTKILKAVSNSRCSE